MATIFVWKLIYDNLLNTEAERTYLSDVTEICYSCFVKNFVL